MKTMFVRILQVEWSRSVPNNTKWPCHPADCIMKLLPLSLPPVTAMDRLPLSLPFSPTDLLWRYPLGFPAATSQPPPMSPLLDFKTHLPTSLGRPFPLWRVFSAVNVTLFRASLVILAIYRTLIHENIMNKRNALQSCNCEKEKRSSVLLTILRDKATSLGIFQF